MDLNTRIVITTKDQTKAGNASVKGGLKGIEGSTKKINAAFNALGIRPLRKIKLEIKQTDAAYKRLASNAKLSSVELNRAFKASQEKVRKLRLEMTGLDSSVGGTFSRISGFVAAFAGVGFATKSIVDATVKMDNYRNALKAATGDSESAADAMLYVTNEAKRLGINLEQSVHGFTQLSAASKGTKIEGQQTREIFTAVAEASRVMGLSAGDTGGTIKAISQIMSKGKLSAEELRQQLGERLPGAFQVAAKSMGVTTAELNKMLERGEIMSDDFLPKFAKELRNTFSDGLEDSINGPAASFERFTTAIFEMKVALGESGMVDALAALAEGLAAVLSAIGELTPVTKAFLGLLAGFGTLALVWKFGVSQIVLAIRTGMIPALAGATTGSRVLSLAMRAIPIIGGALLAIELGRWLYSMATGSDDAATGAKNLADESEKLKQQLVESTQEIKSQANAYKGLSSASDEALSQALKANQRGLDESIRIEQLKSQNSLDSARNITDIIIQSSNERLDILSSFNDDKIALINASTEREVAAAQLAGEKTQDLISSANAAKIDAYKKYESEVEKTLESLLSKEASHIQNVKAIHKEIISHDRDVQKTLRELDGKTLTQAQKNAQALKDIQEKSSEAELELKKGNAAEAKKLILEAEELAKKNALSVRDRAKEGTAYELEAIQARNKYIETTKLASEVLEAFKKSEQEKADAAAEAAETQREKLEEVQQTIVDINQAIAEEKLLKINVNDDQVRDAIDRINAIPTNKTITITTRNVQANQTGGPIFGFNTGGYLPREGQLGGYGGGDKVKALLEPGEFIIRKEAVAAYGQRFMQRINAIKEPIKRRLGGIVPRFAVGGFVGSSSSSVGTVNVTGGRIGLKLNIQPDELNEALFTLEEKIQDQIDDAQQRFNESALQATEQAGELTSRTLERFAQDITRIQKDAVNFSESIDDRIRRIKQAGFTEEERRVDIIKQIREKQAAAEQAIAEGDVERAARLNGELIALAESISAESRDAAGNIIVDQQTAANQAINFLRQAQQINLQITAEKKNQTETAKQAELAAIALEKSTKLAAIEAELQAKLAAIETAKQAELATTNSTSNSSTSLFSRSTAGGDSATSGTADVTREAAELRRQIDLLKSSVGKSTSFGNQYQSAEQKELVLKIQNLELMLAQLLKTGSSEGAKNVSTPTFLFTGTKANYFADGGSVPGQGDGDTVPAMLTPGEWVMNKLSVQKYGAGFMDAVNRGVLPVQKFANGGQVGNVGQSIAVSLSLGNATAQGQFPAVDSTRSLIAELQDAGLVDA